MSSDSSKSQDNRSQSRDSRNDHDNEEKAESDCESNTPVHFFHPCLSGTRRKIFTAWAKTTLILSTFILAILSIYWGAQFRMIQNMGSLGVYVVDFDGQVPPYDTGEPPLVGPTMLKAVQMLVAEPQPPNNRIKLDSPQPHLGYIMLPAKQFNNDPMLVRQAIYDFKAWAAIIINPNATALLRQAVVQGNASYDPTGAGQSIYVQARDDTTVSSYVSPQLSQLQTTITSMFGEMWAKMVLQNASDPAVLRALQRAPQAISPAIGFSTYNLRPFTPPTATPAVSIGLIYLIIISFFSFSFYLPIHMTYLHPGPGHRPLKFYQLIIWRWLATVAAYFCLSLAYSLISLAFQLPFANPSAPDTEVANNPNAYGKGTFVVFWMLNWVGMMALGLACENVAMVVGQPWTALWLIFWVITNVSASFYEIALEPHFYYWGYAWPLHSIVEGSRSILFDLHSRIGLDFGILFAWAALNSALFPLCCWVMRKKSQKGM